MTRLCTAAMAAVVMTVVVVAVLDVIVAMLIMASEGRGHHGPGLGEASLRVRVETVER